MALQAKVDPELCMSSGRCVADAPQSFRFDSDEIAEAVDGARSLDPARLMAIARGCPAAAIAISDGDSVVAVD